MEDVTRILGAIERGDAASAEKLLPLVYDELRRLASQKLSREQAGQTLEPTALVHEAYLKLLGPQGANVGWDGRAHFFAAAAEAMRRILIDNARRKAAIRHGGEYNRVAMDDALLAIEAPSDDVIALDEALNKLAAEDKAKADLVKLHYFAGLSLEEAAAALGISRATAYRFWDYARAWLRHEIRGDDSRAR
jgi:RNA polymerase sigma factor (TIGR02999 family)